ncbi:hypothetical protein [Pseudomonas sp. RA_35y_Pfl2_P32]|uniref:hypothetical protein n=1 Tax=Pseudomonas sp. RA_35y_Pfl2_P32 TaxID=3088705 RepID=UPI0030DB329B
MGNHSLRRGLAVSTYRAGTDFLEIKRQSGWRDDSIVYGYIEEAELFEDNLISSLLRRKR